VDSYGLLHYGKEISSEIALAAERLFQAFKPIKLMTFKTDALRSCYVVEVNADDGTMVTVKILPSPLTKLLLAVSIRMT